MRGHEHLIALRKRGLAPVLVFVDTNETGADNEAQRLFGDDSSSIWIELTDNVPRLDLRCISGLQVSVAGDSAERVREVTEAMKKAGARRVMASVLERVEGGGYIRFNVVSETDTDDELEAA